LPARRRRRHAEGTTSDPDAIWKGDVDDADIVMTAAEHAARRAERDLAARRRTLVEMFGEPVGSLVAEQVSLQHRRRGDSRSGAPIDQARTAGCREEIQVSVLAHPVVAAELIDDLMLLHDLAGVSVDESSRESHRKQITWDARVRTTPWSHRRARLRLYGSPSSNVTVLTLTPIRSRRRGTRLFLRAGLASMFDVRTRVERALVDVG
jgi:hypothetical protein